MEVSFLPKIDSIDRKEPDPELSFLLHLEICSPVQTLLINAKSRQKAGFSYSSLMMRKVI